MATRLRAAPRPGGGLPSPDAVLPTPGGALLAPPPPAPLARRLRAVALRWWDRIWLHPAREQVVPLAALSAVSTVSTASSPALLHWPLLLVALSPRIVFLSLAAAQVHWLPFLLVGTFRLCLADPFHHRIGELCGVEAVGRLPGPIRRWVERSAHVQRPLSVVAVVLRPNGLSMAWAGSQGIPRAVALPLAAASTVVYLLALRAGAAAVIG